MLNMYTSSIFGDVLEYLNFIADVVQKITPQMVERVFWKVPIALGFVDIDSCYL